MNDLDQFPLEMSVAQATIAGKGRDRISSDRSHWTRPAIDVLKLQAHGPTADPRRLLHRLASAGARSLSAAAFLGIGLSACGGGGSASPSVDTTPAAIISGAVVDAFVINSSVSPFQVNADGTIGPLIPCVPVNSCPASTDASGNYTLNLGGYSGPVLLQATGGTYTDTVTGQTVSLPAGLTLSALLPSISPGSTAVTAQLTPFTSIAAQLALQQISQAAPPAPPLSLTTALQASSTAVANAFGGIPNLVETPLLNLGLTNCGAGASQASYDASLLLAGVAQLASNFKVKSIDLANATAQDAVFDSVLDGLASGTPIAVPLADGSGTIPLTTIYGSGLGQSLRGSITTFETSFANACQAALSTATGNALLTARSIALSASSTYDYTLTGLVSGFTGTGTVELQYSVGLGCTNPADVLAGPATSLKIYLTGNGGFSGSLRASPNSYMPVNYNNACKTNTWYLAVKNGSGQVQSCNISPSSGTFVWADSVGNLNAVATSPVVSCSPVLFTVGGSVANLSSGPVTITNTSDGDSVTLTTNGAFTFPTQLTYATAYNVVATPANCAVSGGNGSINDANVTNVQVNCAAVALSSISVQPANPSISVGATQQFIATGTYSDQSTRDVTSQVRWLAGNVSAATISNQAGAQGLATALSAGTTSITATLDNFSAATTLTVTSPLPPACLPTGSGGGVLAYENQSYCATFSGTTDMMYTFTGHLTFSTPLNATAPGNALTACQYWSSGQVSIGGGTASTQSPCMGTIDANGNVTITDLTNDGNGFAGVFSGTNDITVSGRYSFGVFGPQGGVAAGTFTGTKQ